jgi:phospholipid transport system substrate-binding protein
MANLLHVVFSLLLISQIVVADDKSIAEKLLKSKIDAVYEVLQKKELEPDERDNQVIDIVSPIFDFPLMAKLALGRKYWPDMPKEKKESYSKLFTKRLQDSYLAELTLYEDQKVVYKTPVKIKKKIHIPTELISKSNKIHMLYKLYKSKDSWKIYDVEIQGVSIISTYRSQFSHILEKGTIDDLLLKLEKVKDQ